MCARRFKTDGAQAHHPPGAQSIPPPFLSPRRPDGQQGGEQEEGHGGCAGYFRPVGEEGFRCCPLPTPKVGVFRQSRYPRTPPPPFGHKRGGCCCSHPVFPKIVPRVLSLTTTSRNKTGTNSCGPSWAPPTTTWPWTRPSSWTRPWGPRTMSLYQHQQHKEKALLVLGNNNNNSRPHPRPQTRASWPRARASCSSGPSGATTTASCTAAPRGSSLTCSRPSRWGRSRGLGSGRACLLFPLVFFSFSSLVLYVCFLGPDSPRLLFLPPSLGSGWKVVGEQDDDDGRRRLQPSRVLFPPSCGKQTEADDGLLFVPSSTGSSAASPGR